MYNCDYCQKQINKSGVCPDCGTTLYTAGGYMVYGPTINDSCECEVAITEKYLIIRKVSKAESNAARFSPVGGLLGVAITETVRKSIARPYGYYALSNIQKGIFPYQTKNLKHKDAIKLINNDGTDFILGFNKPGFVDGTKKVLKKMVEYIRTYIPYIEDGSNMNYGYTHCVNPYVTLDTLDKVRPGVTVQVAPQPVVQPVPQPVVQPATQPIVAPVEIKAEPVQPTTAADIEKIQCLKCGAYMSNGSKYCSECGNKLEDIPQPKRCVKCGTQLDDDDKFCYICGTKVQ